jgi:hypothetical protein
MSRDDKRAQISSAHHCNWSMVPNLLDSWSDADGPLDVYAIRLYLHYQVIAGTHRGRAEESIRETADKLGVSKTVVWRAQHRLAGTGWIEITQEGSRGHVMTLITLPERWSENCTCRAGFASLPADAKDFASLPADSLSLPADAASLPADAKSGAYIGTRAPEDRKISKDISSAVPPKQNLLAAVIDAIRARGGTVQGTGRDGKALKEAIPAPDPEQVADAFITWREWAPRWMVEQNHYSIHSVLDAMSGYHAWVKGGRPARSANGHQIDYDDGTDHFYNADLDLTPGMRKK